MAEARSKVRAIILIITGLIVSFLVLRFFLILFQADTHNFIVNLILAPSDLLVSPFHDFVNPGILPTFDLATILGVVVYAVVGILISEVITGFMYEDPIDIVNNVVDGLFKVLEFFLIVRIVLKLFGMSAVGASFVSAIYNATEWSVGVVPPVNVLGGTLEISTVVVLIIVVIIDAATEGVISTLRTKIKENKTKAAAKPSAPVAPAAVPSQQHITINVPAPTPQPVAQPANINIHVPPAPQMPPSPERQVVTVHTPPSPALPQPPQNPHDMGSLEQ